METEDLYIDINDAKAAVQESGRASQDFASDRDFTPSRSQKSSPQESTHQSSNYDDSDIYMSIEDESNNGANDDLAIDSWIRKSSRSRNSQSEDAPETDNASASSRAPFADDTATLMNGFDDDARMLMMMLDGHNPDDAVTPSAALRPAEISTGTPTKEKIFLVFVFVLCLKIVNGSLSKQLFCDSDEVFVFDSKNAANNVACNDLPQMRSPRSNGDRTWRQILKLVVQQCMRRYSPELCQIRRGRRWAFVRLQPSQITSHSQRPLRLATFLSTKLQRASDQSTG